jgi:hypothetical protein
LPSTCWHHLVILYLFRLQKISSRFSTVFTSSWRNLANFGDFWQHLFNLSLLLKFLFITQIWTTSHSNNEIKWMKKIFLLLSVMWGLI